MTSLGVDWLGQSGFLLHWPTGLVVCIDPYLSHSKMAGGTRERLTPIPVPVSQLRADLVITTHDHGDHFDEVTIRPIAESPEPTFIGPSSCREHWLAMGLPGERFLRLDQGESLDIAGARVTGIYVKHTSGSAEDAIGVMIEAAGFRVYHVGDSELTDALLEQVRQLRPDLLMVPINGQGGNMDARQAAQLTQEAQPRVVVPIHYGMIPMNTADPRDFVDACHEIGAESRVMLMKVGVRFELESANP